jgi:hypothetical protein
VFTVLTQFVKKLYRAVVVERKIRFLHRIHGRFTGGLVEEASNDSTNKQKEDPGKHPSFPTFLALGGTNPIAIDGLIETLARIVLIACHRRMNEGINLSIKVLFVFRINESGCDIARSFQL